MLKSLTALLVLASTMVVGQRTSFAGTRPIGFPELANRTTTSVPDELADRFGEVTTERLPLEANGDRDLVDRLSKLPLDKQPFWLINWRALEAQRNNPQSYPQRPSIFVDPVPQNNPNGLPKNIQGIANRNQDSNNNQASSNAGSLNGNPTAKTGFANVNSGLPSNNNDIVLANKNGQPDSGVTNSVNSIPTTEAAVSSSKIPSSNTELPSAQTTPEYYNQNQVYTDPSLVPQNFQRPIKVSFVSDQGFLPIPIRGFPTVDGFNKQPK